MACKVTLPGLLALTAATLTASVALAPKPAQAGAESGKARIAQAQSTDTSNSGTSAGDASNPSADNNSPASPTPSTAPSGDDGSSASPAAPSSTPVPGSAATDDADRPDKPAMDAATPAPTPAPSGETRGARRQRERQERQRARESDTYRSGSSLRGAPGSDAGMVSGSGTHGARSWELVRPDVTEIHDKLMEAADHAAQARNAVGVVDASQHRGMAVIALHDAALLAQDAGGRLTDPTINDDGTRLMLMDVAFWAERVDPLTVSSDSRLIRKLGRWQEGRPWDRAVSTR